MKYSKNALTIDILYNRPFQKERLIFGTKADGALLPYGKYWRVGANEFTKITPNRNVLFNGNEVAAGTYRIYAAPGAQTFEISLNSELNRWGYWGPDYDLDVLKTTVPVVRISEPVEQFTARFEEEERIVSLIFEWSDVRLKIPIKA